MYLQIIRGFKTFFFLKSKPVFRNVGLDDYKEKNEVITKSQDGGYSWEEGGC